MILIAYLVYGLILYQIIFVWLIPEFKKNNHYSSRTHYDTSRDVFANNKKEDIPYVELYEAIKKSKRTGKPVKYRYGTVVDDGKLYSKKGEEIKNKEAYFAAAEKRYQNRHGYDEDHMRKKEEHKKKVDEYLGR